MSKSQELFFRFLHFFILRFDGFIQPFVTHRIQLKHLFTTQIIKCHISHNRNEYITVPGKVNTFFHFFFIFFHVVSHWYSRSYTRGVGRGPKLLIISSLHLYRLRYYRLPIWNQQGFVKPRLRFHLVLDILKPSVCVSCRGSAKLILTFVVSRANLRRNRCAVGEEENGLFA